MAKFTLLFSSAIVEITFLHVTDMLVCVYFFSERGLHNSEPSTSSTSFCLCWFVSSSLSPFNAVVYASLVSGLWATDSLEHRALRKDVAVFDSWCFIICSELHMIGTGLEREYQLRGVAHWKEEKSSLQATLYPFYVRGPEQWRGIHELFIHLDSTACYAS